jgi:hypothetical protein
MIVQWCVKGVRGRFPNEPSDIGLTENEAVDLVQNGHGIQCNWWRRVRWISPLQIRQKLTATNLDLHVNNYSAVRDDTPFISVTAGCVERSTYMRTNVIHMAEDTALAFATENGARPGFLFFCWLIVGLKPAVSVEAVAEEIRELNTYQSWSAYQTEGEISAKIHIPSNQIERIEWWAPRNGSLERVRNTPDWDPAYFNPDFDPPSDVSNIRELF